jgi:antibiotic biosynthesis monooxygenase (ABM) superfamily enzyme
MDRGKKFLVALWIAFGLFWAVVAVHTAINPTLEPQNGPPVILILQAAMVALCGLVVVRLIRHRNARGTKK